MLHVLLRIASSEPKCALMKNFAVHDWDVVKLFRSIRSGFRFYFMTPGVMMWQALSWELLLKDGKIV